MIVAHNLMAINAQRQFNIVSENKKKSTEKLSSGYRINRAADDAAGLTISEKMRAQIRGLNRGAQNIQDGISLIQVADGALAEVQNMLHRMTELSVQAANDTNTTEDRKCIQKEIQEIAKEIDRVGASTEFNGLLLFDDMFGLDVEGSITSLITSSAAESGYLTEAIKVGQYWYPSATIDFSNINESNIQRLNEQGFSFCCSRGCEEVFDFTFTTDGTPSNSSHLVGKVKHYYSLDISNCKNGKDIVDTLYEYVSTHQPTGNSPDSVNKLPGCLEVSHSNYMMKSNDGKGMIIYANRRIDEAGGFVSDGYATEQEAQNAYPSSAPGINPWAGQIDCSELLSIVEEDKINEINIKCSGGKGDAEVIRTHRMNATLLGVSSLNVLSNEAASTAIELVHKAHTKISNQRSELGAYQNGLEKAYWGNKNTSENVSAAESRIRDVDMAEEMVNYSKNNILVQAGTTIMTQANQSNQGVLSLLQ